ncbi:UNVERIFIED_CONTAM: tetratricopeptide repeat protein [Acetivibrio alkalicellulosi]
MNISETIINNKYRLIEKIDNIDLNTCWIAENLLDGTSVVINLVKKNLSIRIDDVIRFRNETLEVSKLAISGIEKIYDIGEYEDFRYVVRELVQGKSLHEMINEGVVFTIDEAVNIIHNIGEALEHVHSANVIHRDLRPKNIIVTKTNSNNEEYFIIKLINFGLSHILKYNFYKDVKVNDSIFYSSPELSCSIKRSVDERTDIYSLGIIFYQLLTNSLPFYGENPSEIIHQHIANIAVSTKEKNKSVPDILDKIVFKLLEKEPEKRYQTIGGLLKDLVKFKNGQNDFEPEMHCRQIKLNYHTNLIGREEELDLLKTKLNESLESKGSICLIGGEAGRGKTRLVEELRDYTYEKQGVYISVKSSMDDSKTPYSLLKGALNSYHKYYSNLSDVEKIKVQKKVKINIGNLGSVILKFSPCMIDVIGESTPLVEIKPEREKERFYMVINQFFSALGLIHNTIVIILDDLHWVDEDSIKLLTQIMSELSKQKILIIGTYRDDEINEENPLCKFINYAKDNQYPLTQIQLQSFDFNRMKRFVSKLLYDSEENVMEIAKFVLEKGHGNPFFSIEILKQLINEGIITHEKGSWKINKNEASSIEIPPNIINIILKRISELDEQENNILSHAAVIGNKFYIEFLFSVIEDDENDIVRVIDKAITMQLLEQNLTEEGRLFFVHDRIKEAFHMHLEDTKKKELHLKIANMLEINYKYQINKFIFEIAYHYIESGDIDKSLEYCYLAGIKSLENYANEEALHYFSKSIKYIEYKGELGNEKWFFCMFNIGYIYIITGRINEAIKLYKNIIYYTNSDYERAKIYNQIGLAYNKIGDNKNCQNCFEKSLQYQGYHLKEGKIPVIVDILKQLLIHIFHGFYNKPYTKENKDDEKFEQFCLSMNVLTWLYAISGTYKMINVTLISVELLFILYRNQEISSK